MVSGLQTLAEASAELEQEVATLKDDLSHAQAFLDLVETNPLQQYNRDVARERVRLLTSLRDLIDEEFPELGVRLYAPCSKT